MINSPFIHNDVRRDCQFLTIVAIGFSFWEVWKILALTMSFQREVFATM